jgi:hypothetical protein
LICQRISKSSKKPQQRGIIQAKQVASAGIRNGEAAVKPFSGARWASRFGAPSWYEGEWRLNLKQV